MIIFTPIKDIPEYILEMKNIGKVITYNLSSLYEGFPVLNLLSTPIGSIPESVLNGDCNTPEFDISYSNYIFSDNNAFMQLMGIIIPVYQDPNTLIQILVDQSRFRDCITESLAKLIQQRYGYNTNFIYNIEDLLYVEEPDFSIPGLFRMDSDLLRYTQLNPDMMNDIIRGDYYYE